MSFSEKRTFLDNKQTLPSTTSDPFRPLYTHLATRSFFVPAETVPDCVVRHPSGPAHALFPPPLINCMIVAFPCLEPLSVLFRPLFSQNQYLRKTVSFSLLFSVHTALPKNFASPLTTLHVVENLVLFTLQKNDSSTEALNEHRTEAQSAQKTLKAEETWVTAITAAHESL